MSVDTDPFSSPVVKVDYQEMLRRAKSIHPDAKLSLGEEGEWKVEIDLNVSDDNENLPKRFEGTPAWDVAHSPSDEYPNQLAAWAKSNQPFVPFEIAAEWYNYQEAYSQHQLDFYNELLHSKGLRSIEKIMSVRNVDSITEEERRIYIEWFDADYRSPFDKVPGVVYASDKMGNERERIEALTLDISRSYLP